jgi:hypothetical protein
MVPLDSVVVVVVSLVPAPVVVVEEVDDVCACATATKRAVAQIKPSNVFISYPFILLIPAEVASKTT